MSDLLKPIPLGDKRSWIITINGQVIDDVQHLSICHSDFGQIEYGLRPEGYDGYVIKQPMGGGSVIVPFVIIKDTIFIGLILQERIPMGGKVWNLPRGYVDPDETHLAAAIRETQEETGFDPTKRIFEVSPQPMNADNSMFMTPEANEGIRYFGFQVGENEVEPISSINGPFKFKSKKIKPISSVGERIFSCSFWPYDWTIGLRDQFTVVGAAKLEYYLRQKAIAESYNYC